MLAGDNVLVGESWRGNERKGKHGMPGKRVGGGVVVLASNNEHTHLVKRAL